MLRYLKKILLFLMLVLVMPFFFACEGGAEIGTVSNNPSASTIMSVKNGPVFVQKNGSSTWLDGKAGMELQTGDCVKTDPNGSATIVFFEGSVLELQGETEISLTGLTGNQNTSTTVKVRQEIGTTISRVKKLVDTASSYEIETPAAIAGVRGTVFKVVVLADGTTTVSNEEGSVYVTAQGKTVILKEQTSVTVKPGQEPGEPKPYVIDITSPIPAETATPTPSLTAQIAINRQFPVVVWKGDEFEITYSVFNPGSLPLSNVSVSEGVSMPIYVSGDVNGNKILETGEIWQYTSQVETQWNEPDSINVRAVASGESQGISITAEVVFTIEVHSFYVLIDSPEGGEGTHFNNPTQTITGRVGDPSYTEVKVSVNGVWTTWPVVDRKYSGIITLAPGENTIKVGVQTDPTTTITTNRKWYYDP
jgi:hypothetical protein